MPDEQFGGGFVAVDSFGPGAERGGDLAWAGRAGGGGCGCEHGDVGQAGEILAGLPGEVCRVSPAVGDAGVLADLRRVGAGGGEHEGADDLAAVNAVVTAEVGPGFRHVQPVAAGQDAAECIGEGLAGQWHAARQAPFVLEVASVLRAEQDALV